MNRDPVPSLLLIGHSHAQCVVAAHAARGTPGSRLDAVLLFRDKRSGHEADFEAYLEGQLRALGLDPRSPADLVVLMMAGNTHNTLGLLRMDPPFDYVLAERPDLPLCADASLVPEQVVHDTLASRMEGPLRGLDRLARRYGPRVVCIETPPPLGDDDYVRGHLDEHFRQGFGEGRDIVPGPLRYKLWRTSCAIFRRRCEAVGLPYLPTPEATLDQGMYLRPEGYPNNVTHGNAWFGGHLLDAILAHACRLRADGVPLLGPMP